MHATSADRSAPTAASTLALLIDRIRPKLADRNLPTKLRSRLLWTAVTAARGLAAPDVIRKAFTTLAVEAGLIDRRGFWVPSDVRDTVRGDGGEDIAHLINWGLRGWNPFEDGPARVGRPIT